MAEYKLSLLVEAIDKASGTLKGVSGEIGALGKSAQGTLREIQPLGTALAAVSAAGSALIVSSALTAARTEELGLVLNVMAANARQAALDEGDLARASELAGEAVWGAVEAIKAKGITTQVASKLTSQFVRYELDMADATGLARVAQDAAVISMQDSSEALDGLLHGILTYNPRVLRTYGITVSATQAFEKYADANGIAAAEMDGTQKAQAILNAVMEEGKSITGAYEAAMGSAGKQLRSMPRHWEEARAGLGEAYLPLMGKAVAVTTDVLKAFNALEPAQKQTVSGFVGVGTAVTGAVGGFILLAPRIIATAQALGPAGHLVSDTTYALRLMASGANVADLGLAGLGAKAIAIAGPLAALTAAVLLANAAMEGHHEETIELSDSYEQYVDMMRKTGRAALILAEAEWDVEKATSSLADGWTTRYSPALTEARTLTDGWTTALIQSADAAEVAVEAHRDLDIELTTLKQTIAGPVGQAMEDFEDQQRDLHRRARELRDGIADLAAQPYLTAAQKSQMGEWKQELGGIEGSLSSLEQSHREAMNNIIYDMVLARLAVDGFTEDEMTLAATVAESMGLIDEETADMIANVNDSLSRFDESGDIDAAVGELRDLRSALLDIPTDIQIRISLSTPELGVPGTPNWNIPMQHGTSYFPGGLALIGEAGPELVALPRGSQVYPAHSPQTQAFRDERSYGGDTIYINDQMAAALYLERKRQRWIERAEAMM